MADNVFDQFDQQATANVFDQFDAPKAEPKVKRQGFMISEYDDGSFGLGSVTGPIVRGVRDMLPAAAQYQPGTNDIEGADRLVRAVVPPAEALTPVTPGRMAASQVSSIWRDGTARGLMGTPTGQSIAAARAAEAVQDDAAHQALGVRPFGPSFNQGPVASVGKQLTETPFIGAPLRNALDETYQNMGQAAGRIADDISPVATAETAGAAAQRGLDRFRFSTLADLDPPDVRALGINPQAPMSPTTVMSRGAAETAEEAAPIWPRIGGRTTTNTRGNPVQSARPLNETFTTRTTAEMLDDDQLARLVRTPATQTSVATRAEALYERAYRMVPDFFRSNNTANGNLLATVNSANAIREIQGQVASNISGQRVINGQVADWLTNPSANMTLATMRSIRTEVGRALSNYNPLQQSLDKTQLKAIYASLSRDMEVGLQTLANRAAVRSQYGDNSADRVTVRMAQQAAGALRAFRTADRYYRQSMERMDRFSQVLQAQSPEQAANRLVRASMSGNKGDIRQFRAAMAGLRAEERAEFGAMVVRNLGTPNASARGMVQEHGFSAQTFVTNFQKMSPEARNLAFMPEHQRALDQLFRVANRIANVEALANTSRSASNALNVSAIIGSFAQAATGDIVTPIAIGTGGFATSVVMSRPEYVRWMTQYIRLRAAVRNGTDRSVEALQRHMATPVMHSMRAALMAERSPPEGRTVPPGDRMEPADPDRTGQFAAPLSRPQGGYVPNAGELDQPLPEPQEAPQPDLGASAMPFEGGNLPQGSVDWEGGNRFARGVGSFAAEATGVPSIVRGAGDVRRGYNEGDPLRAASGVGQIALGAFPGASTFRGGRAALAAATETAPRAAATMGAALAPTAAADVRDARAGGAEQIRSAVEGDQRVQALRGRLEQLRGEQQRILSTPIKGLNKASADAARERMSAPLNDEIATLVGTPDKPGLIKQAEDAAAQGYLSNAPFRERYPGTAEALLYGGAGLAAFLPMANTMRHQFTDRLAYGPQLEAQAGRVENALRGSTTQPGPINRLMGGEAQTIAPNQGVFETERATLRNMLASREAREPSHLGQMAAGTAIMQEARMIPEEVDAIVFPYGHPSREAATNALLDPMYYAKGIVPSVLGGASAAHLGNKAGGMMSPRAADVERARAAADLRWKGEARPSSEPSKMGRIGEAATQRVESWLQPAARSPAPGGSTPGSLLGPGGTPGTGSSQGRLPGNTPLQPGSQPPSVQPAQARPSQGSPYGPDHRSVSSTVIEGYVASGKTPTIAQMREDLVSAYKQSGVPAPRPADLTKRVNATHEVLKGLEKFPADVRRDVLQSLMGKSGFLAVPASVGLGANALMQDYPQ